MADGDIPDLVDCDAVQDSDDEEGWMECGEEIQQQALCLFCRESFPTQETTFQHCKAKHQFDILIVQKLFSLDTHGYIKLVNYIRSTKSESSAIITASGCKEVPWAEDKYLQPVIPDDLLLQCDPDDFEEYDLGEHRSIVNSDPDAQIQVSHTEMRAMVQRVKAAEDRAQHFKNQLVNAMDTLNEMKSTAQVMFGAVSEAPVSSHEAIQNIRDGEDEVYFNSYGHFSIHAEMLKDKVRTEYYRDCIMKNADLFKDKVVLDVGCGTGILSMFAAKAGAKKVIGVDMSDILYSAMDIVKENGLEDTITLVKGRMEDVTLPVDKVDIIISEWMGYFLLFESMLDSVLWARDKYLQPGGRLLPDACTLFLSALADPELDAAHVKYWDDVYGFRMSCMRAQVVKEASVAIVRKEAEVSEPCAIKAIDITTCSTKDLEFSSPFQLTVNCDCEVNALVGYFDISWDHCTTKLSFSTSPSATPTHWKQTVFLLSEPIQAKKGDTIEGTLLCIKNRKDPRSLDITIKLPGGKFTYYMN